MASAASQSPALQGQGRVNQGPGQPSEARKTRKYSLERARPQGVKQTSTHEKPQSRPLEQAQFYHPHHRFDTNGGLRGPQLPADLLFKLRQNVHSLVKKYFFFYHDFEAFLFFLVAKEVVLSDLFPRSPPPHRSLGMSQMRQPPRLSKSILGGESTENMKKPKAAL